MPEEQKKALDDLGFVWEPLAESIPAAATVQLAAANADDDEEYSSATEEYGEEAVDDKKTSPGTSAEGKTAVV